jgi:hypothetical protein
LDYSNRGVFFADGKRLLPISPGGCISVSDSFRYQYAQVKWDEAKKKIHTDAQLQIKCIPYLFLPHQQARSPLSMFTACLHKGS